MRVGGAPTPYMDQKDKEVATEICVQKVIYNIGTKIQIPE